MPKRPALLLAVLLLGGCAPAADPLTAPSASPTKSTVPQLRQPGSTASPAQRFPYFAVDARGKSVRVFDKADGKAVRTFANPQPSGAPLVFLLDTDDGDWLKVFLPARPNGSTGWVRRRDVNVRGITYRIDVLRGAHQLKLYERGKLVKTFPIGIGTADTPTPGGTFYVKELLQPPDPNGDYGPYAYGLSGFSNVLTSFNGGEGVIGIHGTNQPSAIGKDVSHGCIRLRNADIRYLARRLPLGTPVRILR